MITTRTYQAPGEGSFADELIAMSRNHFTKQAARMTKAVKVAHMGRVLARSRMEKQALGVGGVKSLLGGIKDATKATKKLGKLPNLSALKPSSKVPLPTSRAAIPKPPSRVGSSMPKPPPRVPPAMPKAPARVGTVLPAQSAPIKQVGKVNLNAGPTANLGARPNTMAGLSTKQQEFVSALTSGPQGISRGQATQMAKNLNVQSTNTGSILRRSGTPTAAGAVKPQPAVAPKTQQMAPQPGSAGAVKPQAAAAQNTQQLTPQVPQSQPNVGPQKPPAPVQGPQMPPAQSAQVPPVQGPQMPPGGAAPAQPKQGLLGKVRSAAENLYQGAEGVPLAPDAGKGAKALNMAGQVAAGTMGRAPSTAGAIGGGLLAAGAGKLINPIADAVRGSGFRKQLSKAISGASGKAIKNADEFSALGLQSIGGDAAKHAVKGGMSPRQLHALDNLYAQGGDMPAKTRKMLEDAAGIKYDELSNLGSATEAVRKLGPTSAERVAQQAASKTRKASKLDVAAEGVEAATDRGDEQSNVSAAGRIRDYLNRPLGGPKTRLALGAAGLAVPVVAGMGAYGAYQGMNALSAANQNSQYQYGAQGAPINYSPTSMFPAGQVAY